MGAQGSTEQEDGADKDQNTFITIHDVNYGEAQLCTTQENKNFVLKQKIFTSEEDYLNFNECIQQSQFNHPSLINIQDIKSTQEENFCSSFYSVKYSLEYIPRTLDNLIQEKTESNQRFAEHEIISVLSDILEGLRYLLEKGIEHGNVTTTSIVLTDRGQCKLFIPASINMQRHYVQVLMKMQSQCFLSPELFYMLQDQNLNLTHNQEKSDVFSVGIISLMMTLLGKTEGIYDFDKFFVNADIVNDKLNQIRINYSKDLTDVIQAFLMEEEERCNIKQALLLLQNIKINTLREDFKDQEETKIKRKGHKHNVKTQENKNQFETPKAQSKIQRQIESPKQEELKTKPSYSNLKDIDSLVNNAIDQSKQTQAKYLDSQVTRNKLKDLLQDEVFVPLQPSPYNKANKKIKGKQITKNQGWKK